MAHQRIAHGPHIVVHQIQQSSAGTNRRQALQRLKQGDGVEAVVLSGRRQLTTSQFLHGTGKFAHIRSPLRRVAKLRFPSIHCV